MKRVVLTLVLGALSACTCAQLPDAYFLCEEDGSCAQPGYTCGADGVCRRVVDAGCGPVDSSPTNCGACGVRCAFGACAAGRCVCEVDLQCPSGNTCAANGLCTPTSDPCATVRCPPNQVCRSPSGTCAPVPCADGCAVGETCDTGLGVCRALSSCHLPQACDGGVCEGAPRPDGVACDDAEPCTAGDQCVAGACVGTSYSCPMSTACADNVACAGDGGCAGVPKADGTGCDDGEACTAGDQCTGGVCSGASYSCPATSPCQDGVTCQGDGGCLGTPANEAASCDDGVACSSSDVCVAGTCAGTAYSCPAPTACQQAVACSGDGGCLVTDKNDGDACDDGVACTSGDQCTTGICRGAPGTTYRDVDNDGRGDSNVTATGCPSPAGYVGVGGDCNDNDPNVFQAIGNLVVDLDGDGASTGVADVQCVGDQVTVAGRTYYKNAAGAPVWLVATDAIGADCDDANATLFQSVSGLVPDLDKDGYTVGTPAAQCVGATSASGGRTYYLAASGASTWLASSAALGTDCDDSNLNVFTTVAALVTDEDQDGYSIGTAASQCVGATSTAGGRTYYAGATGLATWLAAAAALGSDCDDTNASTSGPSTWYADTDTDGVGGSTSQVACARPTGYVASTGDCNDGNGNVFQSVASLSADLDRDGYAVGAPATQCVGATQAFGGRTYYRATTGNYTWLSGAPLGTDCDDSNATLFQSIASLAVDLDKDGYIVGAAATRCVGVSSTSGGRTYYLAASGASTWLASSASLGTDCDDSNAALFSSVAALVTDADQDGYSIGAAATQCVGPTSTAGGRTYYANAAGAAVWLAASAALGADCDDASASITGPATYYADTDMDGVGGAISQVSCGAPAGYVASTGDCNDGDGNIFQNIASLSTDLDRDGYSVGAATTQCVGATQAFGGRTYYRATSGAYTWLSGTPLGTDCDDGNASVLGQTTWYVDADLDGRGGAATLVQCTQPGGYTATPGDCNDGSANVFQTLTVYDDTDQDGWTDGAIGVGAQCVGATTTVNSRTYYRALSGASTWIVASLGTDCNDTNVAVFQTVSNLVEDDDRDGYPQDNTQTSACVGAPSTVGGRTYYVASVAANDYWMERTSCINRQGSNCQAPFDCYDLNASATPVQTAYFNVHRGDGSFDYDCSGTATTVTTGTWCSAVSAQATFSEGTCTTSTGTLNTCTATGAITVPAACGGYLSGGATFYNPGVCTAATLRSATRITCH